LGDGDRGSLSGRCRHIPSGHLAARCANRHPRRARV